MDRGDHGLFLVYKIILMHQDRHRINTGRHMLKGNVVVLKCLQHFPPKPNLRVHHILIQHNRAKTLLAGNPGDRIFGFLTGTAHNPGALVLRHIGIADIDRNPLFPYREDRVLMEHRSSHVGKFPQFPVGDHIDPLRLINDTGISN